MALPSEDAILKFVAEHPGPAGKREIARAFGLTGPDKIALKARLKDMENDGLLERGPGRDFHKGGGLPKVSVLRVIEIASDGQPIATPDGWDKPGAPPRVRVAERRRQSALGVGDRVLARIEETGRGYTAHPMKRLERRADAILGILRRDGAGLSLVPTDKKARLDLPVTDAGGAEPGDLVLAEPVGRGMRQAVRVTERLGDPFAPRAFSLIAIHAKGIPHVFPDAALDEAAKAAEAELGPREDLTHLPFLTIDPEDARDHDDAVWTEPTEDGWRAVVSIADVSWYVRSGSALDREARLRGNSVYFPDRVVPMLPEALSQDACSLNAGAAKAVIACHLEIGRSGAVKSWRFSRAAIRCVANIAYEDAQAAADSKAGEHWPVLEPLWDCWRAVATARDKRGPLELDLPERRVKLDERGRIAEIGIRARLDAHRVIEDFMIAANVAAAKALEAKKTPCMYRDHEPPSREKLMALREYLETFDIPLALGQVIKPATFNRILKRVKGHDLAEQISEQVLRTQTQAYYAPKNTGHFGLALGSYAHFTSPIRRYADLLVHRALVSAYGLGDGGLTDAEAMGMAKTGELISLTERRAMEAERDTLARYVAAYLSERTGEIMTARITGTARFGFFAEVDGVGGDGLVPVSTLGEERFVWDEATRVLEGIETGTRYMIGQRLSLRLAEANPITGALRFGLPDAPAGGPLPRHRGRERRNGRPPSRRR
ncbi:MAG: VacB/RNase II family 3'-5' exoribonuclease [Sphingomonadaceae bacterium]|nr:VacB/RNase II family 3'-5' exoribonuclease [Sphingomonadaceae bacterium]